MRLYEITDSQRDFFDNFQFRIIEEHSIGNYELILLHHEMYAAILPTGYTVGLQRKGRDFTSMEDQLTKQSIDSLNIHDLKIALEIVIEWVKKYGSVSVGSFDERKNKFYERVLLRAGLSVQLKNVLGQNLMIVSV